MYDSSLLLPGEDTSSSAAATSSGGALGGGSTSGTGGSAGVVASNAGAEAGGSVSHAGSGGSASAGASGATTAGGSSSGSGGAGSAGAGGLVAFAGAGGSGSAAGASSSGAGGGSPAGSGGGGATGVDPCSRANWTGTASEASLTMTPPSLYTPAVQAVDGNGNTRWSSGAAQVGGEWFLLDLGAVAPHLTQIVLDTSTHPSDYPTTYKLELSSNGSAYTFVASGSGSSMTTIKFSDKSARYLKVTQTGTSSSWWSIQEISVSCQSN